MQNLENVVRELVEYTVEEEWFEFKENWYEESGIGEYISLSTVFFGQGT